MNTNYLIAIVVIVLIALGAWFFLMKGSGPVTNPYTDGTSAPLETTNPNAIPEEQATTTGGVSVGGSVSVGTPVTVSYSANGFSPKSVTVKVGQTVTWTNSSGGPMWVATDVHPSHTDYDGSSRTTHCTSGYTGPTPFDECAPGNSYSFTFTKVGTWPYHNHAGAEDQGQVIVTQ